MPTPSAPDRPTGRTEVIAALLEAATRLFAQRGPAAVSLRDVAKAANVNLGLIHRYIGSKDDLLAAVLASRPGYPRVDSALVRSSEEIVELVVQLLETDAPYAQIVLRAALDGLDVARLQETFPLLEHVADVIRGELPRAAANARVAFVAAAALGWQTVRPMLVDALELQNVTPEEFGAALRPALLGFLQAAPLI